MAILTLGYGVEKPPRPEWRKGARGPRGKYKESGARAQAHARHGESRGEFTPEYRAWCSMRQRCTNPANKSYKHYGARGITITPEWSIYENFLRDMGRRPSPLFTLERKDTNGPYCKDNCIWADRKTQSRNRRYNVLLTYNGITMCTGEWAERLGLTWDGFYKRRKRGLTDEQLFSPKETR